MVYLPKIKKLLTSIFQDCCLNLPRRAFQVLTFPENDFSTLFVSSIIKNGYFQHFFKLWKEKDILWI